MQRKSVTEKFRFDEIRVYGFYSRMPTAIISSEFIDGDPDFAAKKRTHAKWDNGKIITSIRYPSRSFDAQDYKNSYCFTVDTTRIFANAAETHKKHWCHTYMPAAITNRIRASIQFKQKTYSGKCFKHKILEIEIALYEGFRCAGEILQELIPELPPGYRPPDRHKIYATRQFIDNRW